MDTAEWATTRPRLKLSLLFILWKSCILGIALLSPGLGYDTSTSLLFAGQTPTLEHNDVPTSMERKIFALVRWDSIYYSQMAQHGLVYEQEWAFGIGIAGTISFLKKYIFSFAVDDTAEHYVLTGVILSHLTHWLAVLLLFSIANLYLSRSTTSKRQISFIAAALHIMSPAGIFLSAPCSESTFAFLNMFGYYLYLRAVAITSDRQLLGLLGRVLAGVAFGLATVVRSNGVLSGVIFLLDAVAYAGRIINPTTAPFEKPGLLVGLQFTIIAGLCIALGMVTPQYLAYQQYCTDESNARPWCSATLPSIFAFVQSHYWNVGFLRYWTVSNIPLFLLAAPQLFVLIRSGLAGCNHLSLKLSPGLDKRYAAIRLALPQLILAVLALFSYHVQIISRLSSGYPFWYIWLAATIQSSSSQIFIRGFIIYGIIQAGLYANFLPPA